MFFFILLNAYNQITNLVKFSYQFLYDFQLVIKLNFMTVMRNSPFMVTQNVTYYYNRIFHYSEKIVNSLQYLLSASNLTEFGSKVQ